VWQPPSVREPPPSSSYTTTSAKTTLRPDDRLVHLLAPGRD
jgi:hypothetical protein